LRDNRVAVQDQVCRLGCWLLRGRGAVEGRVRFRRGCGVFFGRGFVLERGTEAGAVDDIVDPEVASCGGGLRRRFVYALETRVGGLRGGWGRRTSSRN